jgi:hypothetical protein
VSRQISAQPVAQDIAFWTDPAFGWYAKKPPTPPASTLRTLAIGQSVLRDDKLGKFVVSEARLRQLGFRLTQSYGTGATKVTLWRRVQLSNKGASAAKQSKKSKHAAPSVP